MLHIWTCFLQREKSCLCHMFAACIILSPCHNPILNISPFLERPVGFFPWSPDAHKRIIWNKGPFGAIIITRGVSNFPWILQINIPPPHVCQRLNWEKVNGAHVYSLAQTFALPLALLHIHHALFLILLWMAPVVLRSYSQLCVQESLVAMPWAS